MPTNLAKTLALAVAAAALFGTAAGAGPLPGEEWDFNDGVLTPWQGVGDAGVADFNVIEGDYSAFITTDGGAVGDVCSFLIGPFVDPPTDKAIAKVGFKVRYKTDEGTGPFTFFEDPFHAELVTGQGAVDLLTIKTDGIFWPTVRPLTLVFQDGQRLRKLPAIPTFVSGSFYENETPTINVSSTLPLKGCDPVRVKFNICDWVDNVVDSAAFIDVVSVKFVPKGSKCLATQSLGVEEFPAPRE